MNLKNKFKNIPNNNNKNDNNKKQKLNKKSTFLNIPNYDNVYKELSKLLINKEITYKQAFNLLKETYPNELKKVSSIVSLTSFLKGHKYLGIENYKKYINSVSKTDFANEKRKIINQYVIKDLLENHLDKLIEKLFENSNFIKRLKEYDNK